MSSHPFVDDIVIECNDVERCSKDNKGMKEDMDNHDAPTQDSTYSECRATIILIYVWCLGF